MDIITRLQETKDKTLGYYDISDEKKLYLTYGPGKWTVKQILWHLSDAETVLYERIRRIISEDKPVLWAFHPDHWEKSLNYSDLNLLNAKNIYSSVRDAIIELAGSHYEKNGHLPFIHSETGIRTLKDEMDKVPFHNESHLSQIDKALQSNK